MPLNFLFIWKRMLLFYIIFGDRNPNYPSGELWAPIFHQQEDQGKGSTFFNGGGLRRVFAS